MLPSVRAWLALPCTAVDADQDPNVIVLFADDLGSKDIGCYSGPVKTMALDGLADKRRQYKTGVTQRRQTFRRHTTRRSPFCSCEE